MQVSGLVLNLEEDAEVVAPRIKVSRGPYAGRISIELGVAVKSDRLPAILEAPSARASKAALRWLEEIDGVAHVDVVFISDLDESESE